MSDPRSAAASRPVRERSAAERSRAAHLTAVTRPLVDASAAVGIDAVHIPTWAGILDRVGPALGERIYTAQELAFAAGRTERLATRLAAKEAVLKALGTGIRGVGLQEVEIVSTPEGLPTVVLHGAARSHHASLGLGPVAISLSHEDDTAYAIAIALPLAYSARGLS